MQIDKDVELKKYTTLKIGGVARNFYNVESIADIIKVFHLANNERVLILGGGSNLLVNDEATFAHVINMNSLEKILGISSEGIITASASVKIQSLLRFANKNNLGGAEYLYSLPATVGGVVAMNAGRGRAMNQMISDYIIDVKVVRDGEVMTLSKEECGFLYRHSSLVSKNTIIVSARFRFDEVSMEEGSEKINERVKYAKELQDAQKANAGSVFKTSNGRVMAVFRRFKIGNKEGICFSSKTNNWLLNNGKGTFKEAAKLINIVKVMHKILGKECELEWIVWEK